MRMTLAYTCTHIHSYETQHNTTQHAQTHTHTQAPEPVSLDACVTLSRLMLHEENAKNLLDMQVTQRLLDLLTLNDEYNNNQSPPSAAGTPPLVTPQMQLYVLHVFRTAASSSRSMCERLADKTSGRYEAFSKCLIQLLR